MKILVLEYVTGGGLLAEPISVSLAREGELMLGALGQRVPGRVQNGRAHDEDQSWAAHRTILPNFR